VSKICPKSLLKFFAKIWTGTSLSVQTLKGFWKLCCNGFQLPNFFRRFQFFKRFYPRVWILDSPNGRSQKTFSNRPITRWVDVCLRRRSISLVIWGATTHKIVIRRRLRDSFLVLIHTKLAKHWGCMRRFLCLKSRMEVTRHRQDRQDRHIEDREIFFFTCTRLVSSRLVTSHLISRLVVRALYVIL